MIDFLRNSLGPGTFRVDELTKLIQNPSINSSLIFFRSLTDMAKKETNFNKVDYWSVSGDTSFRLKFDFIVYWSLGEKKLSSLTKFALDNVTEQEMKKYGLPDPKKDPPNEVILEEMLPGNMDDNIQSKDGTLLFNPVFDKDQKKD